jgi:quinol-cytochrome oxidoreductase complex cytochrome b subunit
VKQRIGSFGAWLEDRLGIGGLMRSLLAGTVERHGAWLRTTGFVCLVLVLVECVTGPILALYYTPSPSAAYRDIVTLEQNPLGRFLRGLHHWGSATLIILALLTVIRMFFMAEYKRGRDVVWIAALLFFQFVLFFQLTGHILPWDTNAVATAEVEAGFGGNVWGLGTAIKRFLLGGGSTGAATLTRWYGFHALLLPLLFALLVALPLFLHRLRAGRKAMEEGEPVTDETPRPATDPYYPVHLAREITVAVLVFLVVAGMAWFGRTPHELPATMENLAEYKAMSEWYVLPMHALTLIPPFNNVALEPLATFVLPGLLFTVLILLPFIDRNPARSLRKRPLALLAGVTTLVATAGMTLWVAAKEGPEARKQSEQIAIKMGRKKPEVDARLVALGKELYGKNNCVLCHKIGGEGGVAGPDLTRAVRLHPDRQWQIEHLVKPDSKVPGSTMPAYGHLKPDEIKALAEYMMSLY